MDKTGADLRVDHEQLREVVKELRHAAAELRNFDPSSLEPFGEVGHADLAEVLDMSADARRQEIRGVIDELDTITDHLQATAEALAEVDGDLAGRFSLESYFSGYGGRSDRFSATRTVGDSRGGLS